MNIYVRSHVFGIAFLLDVEVSCRFFVLSLEAFDNVHYMLLHLHDGKPMDMYLMIIPNWESAHLDFA